MLHHIPTEEKEHGLSEDRNQEDQSQVLSKYHLLKTPSWGSSRKPTSSTSCVGPRLPSSSSLLEYLEVLDQLEAEKKRSAEWSKQDDEPWWEAPIDDHMGLHELQHLKMCMEELKKNVVKRADELVAKAANNSMCCVDLLGADKPTPYADYDSSFILPRDGEFSIESILSILALAENMWRERGEE
ncbi:hypothetical protein NE237_005454 [Protea cynaroides]|uniref:Uncharacterized protein n=1 Tax=Protea cynaroides TaxID=273540 RepID=A0A9Q0QUA7_9MAGN|nr:hypothetical protein NE237_005454 [Protea cynaroides]